MAAAAAAEPETLDKPRVVVFTGNSNTGLATIKYLCKNFAGQVNVRAVVRSKKKSAALFDGLDVEIMEGDILQPKLLPAIFQNDVNAAFFATPATEDRAKLVKKFIDVCIEYGVDFPVLISVLDADRKVTTFQKQMSDFEDYAKAKAGTPVKRQLWDKGKQVLQPIILRSGLFYQNFYGSIAGIQSGTLYYPLGNGAIPHVDIEDIGKVVATILMNPDKHGNKTYNLIGEYQAGNQIATSFTRVLGKGVKYSDVDDETAVVAFKALGLQEWQAVGSVETLIYHREGGGQDITSDIATITGAEPTRFNVFVKNSIKPLLK